MLAAFSRFFGRTVVMDELIRQVLQVEQMLTTGGGWQDQIGGAVGGIKCIQSRPGFRPHPVIHQLDPFLFQDPESLACFSLFYTGITRLARNILAEVVDQVNSGSRAYQFTLQHMAQLALDAKDAIERRDRRALAGRHRPLLGGQQARAPEHHQPRGGGDPGRHPRALRRRQAPRRRGRRVRSVRLPGPRTTPTRLRDLLRQRFENERARLVDFSLSTCGLEVSAS